MRQDDRAIPGSIDIAANRAVLQFVSDLSAHSDLWQKLSDALQEYADVEMFCPDPAAYRYVVAHVGPMIFAFAVGMSEIHLRLDAQNKVQALAAGARDDHVAGSGWVYFRLWQGDGNDAAFREFVAAAVAGARVATP